MILLENCLSSIQKFTSDVDYEIIIIDNNSTDGEIESVTNQFENIVLIKNEKNEGFAKANNRGAQIAKGKYLMLLNNDTILFENSVKVLLDYARKQSNHFVLSCKLLNPDNSLQLSAYKFPNILRLIGATFFLDQLFPTFKAFNKYDLTIINASHLSNVDAVVGALLFLKKETFFDLKGFDERFYFYYEDIDLCQRLKNRGGVTIYVPDTAIYHIGGATAEKSLWFYAKNRSISRIQYAQKNFRSFYKSIFIFTEQLGKLYKLLIFVLIGILSFNRKYFKKAWINIKLIFIYPRNKFIKTEN